MSDPDNSQQFYFHGSTPVPHPLVDEWLSRVTAKRFLVLLFMWRKLVGYQKWRDFISLSQVARGTGVSVPTAIKELGFWERVGVFRRTGRRGKRGITEWEVLRFKPAELTPKLDKLLNRVNPSIEHTGTSQPFGVAPLKPVNTQEQGIQEQERTSDASAPGKNRKAQEERALHERKSHLERCLKMPLSQDQRLAAQLELAQINTQLSHMAGPAADIRA